MVLLDFWYKILQIPKYLGSKDYPLFFRKVIFQSSEAALKFLYYRQKSLFSFIIPSDWYKFFIVTVRHPSLSRHLKFLQKF